MVSLFTDKEIEDFVEKYQSLTLKAKVQSSAPFVYVLDFYQTVVYFCKANSASIIHGVNVDKRLIIHDCH